MKSSRGPYSAGISFLVGLAVAILTLAELARPATAQTTPSGFVCPSSSLISPCTCVAYPDGLRVTCSNNYATVTNVQKAIKESRQTGPIKSLILTGVSSTYFNYVKEDFLEGAEIPSVSISCSHGFSTTTPQLAFLYNAFQSAETGRCGLTGELNITDCNLRQWDLELLTGCTSLAAIRFVNNYIENMVHAFPRLGSLSNLTIYTDRTWSGTTRMGLQHISLPSDSLPNLSYLDLTGNSLEDDVFGDIRKLVKLEKLFLDNKNSVFGYRGNSFSAVPDLTDLMLLDTFTIQLNDSQRDVSISLPNPRKLVPPLNVEIKQTNTSAIYSVRRLDGPLTNGTIKLLLRMENDYPLEESVFRLPLERLQDGLLILNNATRFDCSCGMAWLLRDRPHLVSRIQGGFCLDSQPFSAIEPDFLSCCPVRSLVQQLQELEAEVRRLRDIHRSSPDTDQRTF